MAKGDTYPSEKRTFKDEESGRTVHQLTGSDAHDHHIYFTGTSFHPDGERIIFGSERTGKPNLFEMDLDGGAIRQLTDAEDCKPLLACVDPLGEWVYFYDGPKMKAVHIDSLEERELYTIEEGCRWSSPISITDDGQRLAFGLTPIIPLETETEKIYSGFKEMFAKCRRGDIMTIGADGSDCRLATRDECWCGHVNINPKDGNVILYCHEGPWGEVDQRMWLVDPEGKDRRALREKGSGDALGHEYWHGDGVTVGYHGTVDYGKTPVFGLIRSDGTNCREYTLERNSGHCQSSSDGALHVCDGAKEICLIHIEGSEGRFELLARHNSSMQIQVGHPHPIFTPDDKGVLYTSDVGGTCNMYIVDL
ncbi:MAG: hypothetical protein GXP25_09650 [Planctomycetes bacterium]|nr:hypothetical protein [Planctomycetota bacterium]